MERAKKGEMIEKLTAELVETRDKLEEVSQEKGLLTGKLKTMESSFPEKVAQVKAPLEREIDSLKEELKKMTAERSQKGEISEKLTAELKELQGRLADSLKEKELLGGDIVQLTEQIKAMETTVPDKIAKAKGPLEDKVRSLEDALGQMALDIKAKESAIVEIEEARDAFAQELAVTRQTKQTVSEELTALNKEREVMEAQLAQLKEKEAASTSEISLLNQKLKESQSLTGGELARAKAQYEGQVSLLQQKLDEAAGRQDEQKSVIDRLDSERRGMEEKLAKAGENESLLKAAAEDLTQRLKGMETALSERLAQAKAPLEEEISTLQSELQRFTTDRVKKDEVVERLTGELTDLRAKLENSVKENELLEDDMLQLNGRIKAMEAVIPDRIAQARAPLQDKIRLLELEIKIVNGAMPLKLAENKAVYDKEINSLNARLREARSLVSEKEAAINKLAQDENNIKLEVEQIQAKNLSLQKELNGLRVALKKTEESVPAKVADVKSRYEVEINLLAGEFKAYQDSTLQKIAEAKTPLEQRVGTLSAQVEEKELLLKEKESLTAELTKKADGLWADLNAANERKRLMGEELETLKVKLKETEQSFPERAAQVKGPLENRIASLEKRLNEMDLVVQNKALQIKDMTDQQKQTTRELAVAKDELEIVQGSIPAKIQESTVVLEKEKAEYKRRLEEYKQAVADKGSLLSALTRQRDEAQNELLAIRKEKEALQGELNTLTRKYDVKRGELTAEISARQEKLEAFEQQGKNKKTYWNDLKREVESALELIRVNE
jgi:chromosome segregation ATPase